MRKDWNKKIQLRPDRVERVHLEQEHLHSSYDLEWDESTDAGESGLLALFHLKSKDPELPSFRGRWDIKQDAVDVDLLDRPNESKLFKTEKGGYRGHHSTTLADRRYQVDIAIPGQEIFRGVLEFDGRGTAELHEEVRLGITDSLRIFNGETGKEIKVELPD